MGEAKGNISTNMTHDKTIIHIICMLTESCIILQELLCETILCIVYMESFVSLIFQVGQYHYVYDNCIVLVKIHFYYLI